MTFDRNETHDPRARSFVASANREGCDFPLQNLPFGAFTNGQNRDASLAVAIGDELLDLCQAAECGLLCEVAGVGVDSVTEEACKESCLNPLMGLGPERWQRLRLTLFRLLREDSPRREELARCLRPQRDVRMVLPVVVRNYTDFYASRDHARNVGALFRPQNPLLENYGWVPIGYHGRASTVVVSGTPLHRPLGQRRPNAQEAPQFGPSERLDYEVELGALIGVGNEMGSPIAIADAPAHLFGLALVNDWSARDVQAWEYQPLGPFLSKSFGTTLSPWIVTAEALAPFRVPVRARESGEPLPLDYLSDEQDQCLGAFDVVVEAALETESMRRAGQSAVRLSRSRARDLYWTFAQMLAHHTSNGCDLRPGDLIASGTLSGPMPEARGCLLELTRGGQEPLALGNGERRSFLEDGDEVVLRASCEARDARRIGFGECRGRLLPVRGTRQE